MEDIKCNIPEKPGNFIFCSGDNENSWLINISKEGIKFNREIYPDSSADDFVRSFIEILEKNYIIKFEKRAEMETETHLASENLMKFFKNLLALKQYIKDMSHAKCDERHVKEIHRRLDKIISESNEVQE